ncbi:hypothetical protein E1A91_D08G047900v1 [Gossypium mustelinum]|uniref:Microsomal glutathione S-transferase 3 n=1 Tax=Gossypium mustelinum TaxID=34275 RepID=A0A5D2TRE2_GOSMU|nr:hypothetical protein E1A91_D08G047900v1 [Gossypium mustelinum]
MEFLAKEYGYVALVVVAYCFLSIWMGIQVGMARKKYKVYYPTLYALESENKDAKLFNCVQRGHQNSLEMMPMFFVLMILGGMAHPCISAALGLFTPSPVISTSPAIPPEIPRNVSLLGNMGSWHCWGSRFALFH